MAGDWIKMRSDLHTSPKVVRISSALKADRLRTVGGLHSVWSLFDVHSADGFMDGYTLETLDDMIGFPGFGAAMVSVGWLVEEADGLSVPRFDEHNGQSAKRRAQDSERKRSVRDVSASKEDKLRTREEKRREEVKAEATASVDSDADAPADDLLAEQGLGKVTPPSGEPKSVAAHCPADRIVKAYHDLMPDNPRVKVLNDARRRTIGARWREASKLTCKPFGYATTEQGLEAWRDFFGICADSDFLTGKSRALPGKPPFIADIDFLMSPDGFAKILENKYHREAQPA